MSASIPLWNVWEILLRSDVKYTDPWRDVSVTLTLAAPSGNKHAVEAFWDGGDAWRARFSPDETGSWTWRAESTDAGNKGFASAGSFECVRDDATNPLFKHGPLRISDDGHSFVTQDGAPFFWLADTAWNGALRSRDDDWDEYLKARSGQGFNVIQVVCTQWRGGNEVVEGPKAFTGRERIAINPAFFQRMDRKLAAINAHGMFAAPVLLWANDQDDPGVALPEQEAILLARYMVARWGALQVIWFLPGDGIYSGESAERWQRIGRAVFTGRRSRLVTVHPGGLHWFGDEFKDEPWFDFIGYQSGHGESDGNLRWLLEGPPATWWRGNRPCPLINLEPNYEAHPSYETGTMFGEHEIRRAAYWSLMVAPTAGVTFGHNSIWCWNEKTGPAERHPNLPTVAPWREGVDPPGVRSMTVMKNFFEALPWSALVPAQEILAVAPSNAVGDLPRFITVAATPGEGVIVAYLPAGGEISLRGDSVPPNAVARWFDPRTGKTIAAERTGTDTVKFHAPDEKDWVLTLQR